MRWRVKLSPYSYDIHYRPGKDNVAADTFTRVKCAAISSESLNSLHSALCHPSITRLHHFVRSRNLAYSLENIKHVCNNCSSKSKNDKIFRWRVKLSPYSYDIHYRPGKDNVAADTFTRVKCAAISSESLNSLHSALCHPGITRLHHFVRSRNLAYSLENIKHVCNNCRICQEVKPKYYKPEQTRLVKATQPFERLSINFKGPLPSSKNEYILTIIDEYSRFPFVFPVKDICSTTVIKSLSHLFTGCLVIFIQIEVPH